MEDAGHAPFLLFGSRVSRIDGKPGNLSLRGQIRLFIGLMLARLKACPFKACSLRMSSVEVSHPFHDETVKRMGHPAGLKPSTLLRVFGTLRLRSGKAFDFLRCAMVGPDERGWSRVEVSRPCDRKKSQKRGMGLLWRVVHYSRRNLPMQVVLLRMTWFRGCACWLHLHENLLSVHDPHGEEAVGQREK